MTLLFIFGILALVTAGVVVLPLLVLAAALWVVTLPFRIAFNLLFGGLKLLLGLAFGLLSLIALPFVLLIAGIGLTGALLAGVLSLVAPLVPLALLGLLGWGIYRLAHRHGGPYQAYR
jgi:hypothetical protein